MTEACKTCKGEFDSGIWLAPQFSDEKVLLFCSEKCKEEYIKQKLGRIKSGYPGYYKKIMKHKEKTGKVDFWAGRGKDEWRGP
ncbi:MAG: hypothetical protein AABX54_01475 [Nanoarchaeota archaeon]